MTTEQQQQTIQKGDPLPLNLIYNGAKLVVDLITTLLANRSTLRQRVTQLEGLIKTQSRQIKVLEDRIRILEGNGESVISENIDALGEEHY